MEILDTTPDNAAVGIALESTISIVFDEEVDPDSIIGSGNLVVVTSASKVVEQGPGLEDFNPLSEDLLASESFSGFVDGTISTDDNLTIVFTPDAPLKADRLYRVIISTKVVSNTIGAIAPVGAIVSTGGITPKGPYTDDINDTFTIEVSSTGTLGIATFTYHRASTGLTSEDIPTDRLVTLDDGVKLAFTSGTFTAGDVWAFDVTVGEPLDDIYEFSFTTGSISHTEVSEDTPSFQIQSREIEGLRRIDNLPSVNSGTLSLVSITPELQDSNIPISTKSIVLTFNKELDPASLDSAVIRVIMENLPLDERQQYSHDLRVTPTISGKTLTLTFSG